jgi:hypothetical protein
MEYSIGREWTDAERRIVRGLCLVVASSPAGINGRFERLAAASQF